MRSFAVNILHGSSFAPQMIVKHSSLFSARCSLLIDYNVPLLRTWTRFRSLEILLDTPVAVNMFGPSLIAPLKNISGHLSVCAFGPASPDSSQKDFLRSRDFFLHRTSVRGGYGVTSWYPALIQEERGGPHVSMGIRTISSPRYWFPCALYINLSFLYGFWYGPLRRPVYANGYLSD